MYATFGDDRMIFLFFVGTRQNTSPGQGSGGLASARPGWLAGHSKSTPTLPSTGRPAENLEFVGFCSKLVGGTL